MFNQWMPWMAAAMKQKAADLHPALRKKIEEKWQRAACAAETENCVNFCAFLCPLLYPNTLDGYKSMRYNGKCKRLHFIFARRREEKRCV